MSQEYFANVFFIFGFIFGFSLGLSFDFDFLNFFLNLFNFVEASAPGSTLECLLREVGELTLEGSVFKFDVALVHLL